MKEKARLYSVYTPDEIIKRILKETEPLEGSTGFPVDIIYHAPNDCEPPKIDFSVNEYDKQGLHNVFNSQIDQNTTLEEFDNEIGRLKAYVAFCSDALHNGTSFAEEQRKSEETDRKWDDGELPF